MARRVLLLDGAAGTWLQAHGLTEADFRGTRFAHHPCPLKGDNDVLPLTRPDLVALMHRRYLEAGADVIETCTFGAQRIGQQEYHLTDHVVEMNRAAARLARQEADRMTRLTPDRPRYVVGSVGPTGKMLSMSDDVQDPAARSITFDQLEAAYLEQITALIDEGVDAILIETIFDTANAKAALSAYLKATEAWDDAPSAIEKRDDDPPATSEEPASPQGDGRTKYDLALTQGEHPASAKDDGQPSTQGDGRSWAKDGGQQPAQSPTGPLRRRPEVMLSMTVSDASGRTLSGQTIEAFVISVLHARPLSVGLNCGLGAEGMLPYLRQMAECAPCYVTCHPNAGLPGPMGEYTDTPEVMTAQMAPYLAERLVNMVGGCCGTSEAHISAFRQMIDKADAVGSRRLLPSAPPVGRLRLSGMEALSAGGTDFVRVGERCNVAGSRKFLRLISAHQYDEALAIARRQVDDGAMVIDVNMDDGMLDARTEMTTLLNLLASDPAVARVPVMVDSSRFEVIEAGLKCLQGKGVVNSLSLKGGEAEFVRQARIVRRLGAAVIVMAFDEAGQATDYDSRVRISDRAYRLLTTRAGFSPDDIIFDPNVLTVATGMPEHRAYAADFIRATRWIHDHLPGTHVSGGLSNLSFAFRGNNALREAMHAVFLHHAIPAGMDMAILNPATQVDYFSLPAPLALAITEVILDTFAEAGDRLAAIAQQMSAEAAEAKAAGAKAQPGAEATGQASALYTAATGGASGRALAASQNASPSASSPNPGSSAASPGSGSSAASPSEAATPAQRLQQALIDGQSTTLQADIDALLAEGMKPMQIIAGPLMDGMNEVGVRFGAGKMFLPQVVRTARTMKQAVALLMDRPDAALTDANADAASAGKSSTDTASDTASTSSPSATALPGKAGTIVIATVKGDVHDIGKNIVAVILACNGYEVIDLGVMVPAATIVDAATSHHADVVCLSGLITPSLDEMCHVAEAMQQAGLTIPLIVGGATTSPVHTALRIAPLYDGPVFHVRDAAHNPVMIHRLLDPSQHEATVADNRRDQQRIREAHEQRAQVDDRQRKVQQALGAPTPLSRRWRCDWTAYTPPRPPFIGQRTLPPVAVDQLIPLIDWTYFYWPWRVRPNDAEAQRLRRDADRLLAAMADDPAYATRCSLAFYAACGRENDISVTLSPDQPPLLIPTPRQDKPAAGYDAEGRTAQADDTCKALCDYLMPMAADGTPRDHLGAFAATVSQAFIDRLEHLKATRGGSDYDVLLLQTLGDRLAEATAEWVARRLALDHAWGGIRPAVGYPSLPDQQTIFLLDRMVDFQSVGISLTENGAMYPQASVSGLLIGHPNAQYFSVKTS